VISEPKLQETEKQDVLEAVATITKEAAKKPEERSKGTLKLLVAGLPTAITAANNLMILWDKLGPTIKAHFGI
jgi:hypothetical protein